jgi:hypothetical protein
MVKRRQHFARPTLNDIPGTVREEMGKLLPCVKVGQTVGVTVGSRGIQNILPILETAIACIREKGASPALLSAMGSHGGGTAAGPKEVLDSLGITRERLGARVLMCDKGRAIGTTSTGLTAYMLETAWEVDAIIPINRVKTHTSFKGDVESGLIKKLVVGLGGPPGATQFHNMGKSELLGPMLMDIGRIILAKMPVIGGIAIIENGYEESAKIVAVQPDEMIEVERELLLYSKELMPSLPATRIDGLVVEEMGKNYSGTGIDTNIIGRVRIQGQPEMPPPAIRYIAALDLSEASHGNATGVGLADFVTKKLVDKIDRKATYLNCLTTTFVTRAFIPMYFDTEKETLDTMMHCLRQTPRDELRLVFIPNTLFLNECYVSEALARELGDSKDRFEICGKPAPVEFDDKGDLKLRLSHIG